MSHMSTFDREPALLKEFRDLYDYVINIGRHVNLIYKRLDSIDNQLKELSSAHGEFVVKTEKESSEIRAETRATFDRFIGALEAKVAETLPTLPETERKTVAGLP